MVSTRGPKIETLVLLMLWLTGRSIGEEGDTLPVMVFSGSLINYNTLTSAAGRLARNLQKLGDFTVQGAKKDEDCDVALFTSYTTHIYQANDRTTFTNKLQDFLEHISKNPGLEKKSCFTRLKDKTPQFLECDAGTSKCICNTQEPFKSTWNSSTKECEVDKPEIGSPCSRVRTDLLNRKFYNDFRSGLVVVKDFPKTFGNLQSNFASYRDYESLESDRRRACFNYFGNSFNKENLECSPGGTCECVHVNSKFNFQPKNKSGTQICAAEKGAICTLEVTSGPSGATYSNTECLAKDTNNKPKPCKFRSTKYKNLVYTTCDTDNSARNICHQLFLFAATILSLVFCI